MNIDQSTSGTDPSEQNHISREAYEETASRQGQAKLSERTLKISSSKAVQPLEISPQFQQLIAPFRLQESAIHQTYMC